MKRTLGILLAVLMVGATGALAMDHGKMDHSATAMKSDQARKGVLIRETTVDGYKLAYHLIDSMAEMNKAGGKMAGMHDMEHGKMKSHHLMVFVSTAQGAPVTGGQAGYLVEAAGQETQKAMTMEMEGGYGADVDLKPGVAYTVKAKIMAGKSTLVDTFPFTLK